MLGIRFRHASRAEVPGISLLVSTPSRLDPRARGHWFRDSGLAVPGGYCQLLDGTADQVRSSVHWLRLPRLGE